MSRVPPTLGLIQTSWGRFEIALEVYCKNLLSISAIDAHILFAGMSMGAKQQIAISLAKERGSVNEKTVAAIKKANDVSQRNFLFHSIMFVNQTTWEDASFVKRDNKNGLKVKGRDFSSGDELKASVDALADAALKFEIAAEITEEMVAEYVETARKMAGV